MAKASAVRPELPPVPQGISVKKAHSEPSCQFHKMAFISVDVV
jgi:hypothetical protein